MPRTSGAGPAGEKDLGRELADDLVEGQDAMPVGETGLDGIVAHREEMGRNLRGQEIPCRAHDALR